METTVAPDRSEQHPGSWLLKNGFFNRMEGLLMLELLWVTGMTGINTIFGWDVPSLSNDSKVGLKIFSERPDTSPTDGGMLSHLMINASNKASANTFVRKGDVLPEGAGKCEGEFKATADIGSVNNLKNLGVHLNYLNLDWVTSS